MAFLCRVAGHKWRGCECARCGERRDEGHSFKPAEDRCEQTCAVCGKTEAIPHDWHHCACARCGEKRDKAHDWIATSECEQVCRICGKERAKHDYRPLERGIDRCSRCHRIKKLTPEEIADRDENWCEPFQDD